MNTVSKILFALRCFVQLNARFDTHLLCSRGKSGMLISFKKVLRIAKTLYLYQLYILHIRQHTFCGMVGLMLFCSCNYFRLIFLNYFILGMSNCPADQSGLLKTVRSPTHKPTTILIHPVPYIPAPPKHHGFPYIIQRPSFLMGLGKSQSQYITEYITTDFPLSVWQVGLEQSTRIFM